MNNPLYHEDLRSIIGTCLCQQAGADCQDDHDLHGSIVIMNNPDNHEYLRSINLIARYLFLNNNKMAQH